MQIISRKEAKAKGIKFYFTGDPCPKGHISLRYTSCGRCTCCSYPGRPQVEFSGEGIKQRINRLKQEARAAGRKSYFPGTPCANGHICERYLSGGCVMCEKEKAKEFYNNLTPDERRQARARNEPRRKEYRRDPIKRLAAKIYMQNWRQENIARIKEANRERAANETKKLRRGRAALALLQSIGFPMEKLDELIS